MDFIDFRKAYARQFACMSNRLWRGWRLPSAVSREDVEQEMWTGAWRGWTEWQPGIGHMERHSYAVCRAKNRAVRWIHDQRNALRRNDRAPSRFAVVSDEIDDMQSILSTQEVAYRFAESLRSTLADCNATERKALEALCAYAFDVDAAALTLTTPDIPLKKAKVITAKVAKSFRVTVQV
jgi:hypothetical protein